MQNEPEHNTPSACASVAVMIGAIENQHKKYPHQLCLGALFVNADGEIEFITYLKTDVVREVVKKMTDNGTKIVTRMDNEN